MNVERAAMRGQVAELEAEERRLVLKLEGLATGLRQAFNVALTPVAEWEADGVAGASQQMAELEAAYAALLGVQSRLSRLRRELG